MKKRLILYRSKYGSTQEYVKALAERIDGDYEVSDAQSFSGKIKDYDVIILASCTYMGRILLTDFIKENQKILKSRKTYLLIVGLVPQDKNASIQSFESIPDIVRRNLIGYRKIPGRINSSRLNFFERMILKMIKTKSDGLLDLSYIDKVVEDLNRYGVLA